MAREYGAVPYTDWGTMLEKEEIDVVHICTPHYLHTPMEEASLSMGIHTFMEKPPVLSRGPCEKLKPAATAAKDGALWGRCLQYRFHPSVAAVKERITAGEFGKILGARGLVTWCRGESTIRKAAGEGRRKKKAAGH